MFSPALELIENSLKAFPFNYIMAHTKNIYDYDLDPPCFLLTEYQERQKYILSLRYSFQHPAVQ